MTITSYEHVCYWTEQRDEEVLLRNIKNGELGSSFGCTREGETVQVRLVNGGLDSWGSDECVECSAELK